MTSTQPEIDSLVERARTAQQRYEATGSQQCFDKAAAAAAWALMEPSRNAELAAFAVAILEDKKVLVWSMKTQ
jgi:sulfoacetaldehyde dehydrogenase